MEFILVFIALGLLVSFLSTVNEDKKTSSYLDEMKKKTKAANEELSKNQIITPTILEEDYEQEKESKKSQTINIYNTQNIINVYESPSSKSKSRYSKNTDHTKNVWKKLGYKIKYGETYSYKFYGNEIFTPDQVESIKSTLYVHTSENGLAHKLVSNTKSKRIAKDILVDEYGYTESEAKKLVGYKGC